MGDTREHGVVVQLDGCLMTMTLTNKLVRQIHHEKELLENSYVRTIQGYCPNVVSSPGMNEVLEKKVAV